MLGDKYFCRLALFFEGSKINLIHDKELLNMYLKIDVITK